MRLNILNMAAPILTQLIYFPSQQGGLQAWFQEDAEEDEKTGDTWSWERSHAHGVLLVK